MHHSYLAHNTLMRDMSRHAPAAVQLLELTCAAAAMRRPHATAHAHSHDGDGALQPRGVVPAVEARYSPAGSYQR